MRNYCTPIIWVAPIFIVLVICGLIWADFGFMEGFSGWVLRDCLTSLKCAAITLGYTAMIVGFFYDNKNNYPDKFPWAPVIFWTLWPVVVVLNHVRDTSHFVNGTIDFSASVHRKTKDYGELEAVYIRASDESGQTYLGELGSASDPRINNGEKAVLEVHDGLFWSTVTSAKMGKREALGQL